MLKRWTLFAFAAALFLVSFFVINLRYDKFYRINGINNDNQAIIETYLSEDDQNYLIENQIPITNLINYMSVEDFDIHNYEYYELLIQSGRYDSYSELVATGNALEEKAKASFSSGVMKRVTYIVNNALETGFINEEDFNYGNRVIYAAMVSLYSDTSYVETGNEYVKLMRARGMNASQVGEFFTTACQYYNASSLAVLMDAADDKSIRLIANPSELSLTLNDTEYIGSYVPSGLVLIQDVHRLKYAMYMVDDAYDALLDMKEAMGDTLGEELVVRHAYTSFNEIMADNENDAGHSEYQLGTLLAFQKLDTGYSDFAETDVSEWLQKNAWKYGYVLRYQSGHASESGHAASANIYRYVGKEIAKDMHDGNLTLEAWNKQEKEGVS